CGISGGRKGFGSLVKLLRKFSLKSIKDLETVGSTGAILRTAVFLALFAFGCAAAFAQGGPPYLTTDPITPGHLNWEINIGYLPFLYSNNSTTHSPDVDINFGLGSRIQLTYESAWLRVQNPTGSAKYGLEQDILGVKWRFLDQG